MYDMSVFLSSLCQKYVKSCLFHLVVIVFVTFGKKCEHTNDCFRWQGAIRTSCSVCENSVCSYPFSDVLEMDDEAKNHKAEDCFFRGDFCENDNPCVNGICSTGYGRPVCSCDSNHYGRTCQNYNSLTEIYYARSVHIYYPLIFPMGYYLNVEIAPQSQGKDVRVCVTTPEGSINVGLFKIIQGRKCLVPVRHSLDWVEVKLYGCINLYEAELRFPYLPDHPRKVFSDSNYMGYYTYFNITMLRREGTTVTLVYEENFFQIFVKTPPLKDNVCVASIIFQNCGPTWDAPVTYGRGKSVEVGSDVHYYLDGSRPDLSKESDLGCKADSRYIWKIWNFDRFNPHSTLSGSLDERYEDEKISYPATHFTYGLYRIQLEIKYTPGGKRGVSFNWCYFEVAYAPLEFHLDQNLKHKVFIKDGIYLSATKSFDPNEVDTKDAQAHINIEWTCLNRNKTQICFLPDKTTKKWQPYEMKTLIMANNEYTFKARMWTDRYKYHDEKIQKLMEDKYLYISVTVEYPKDYEELPIVCLKNCGVKVLTNERLILRITPKKI